jgi:hypothetical protein
LFHVNHTAFAANRRNPIEELESRRMLSAATGVSSDPIIVPEPLIPIDVPVTLPDGSGGNGTVDGTVDATGDGSSGGAIDYTGDPGSDPGMPVDVTGNAEGAATDPGGIADGTTPIPTDAVTLAGTALPVSTSAPKASPKSTAHAAKHHAANGTFQSTHPIGANTIASLRTAERLSSKSTRTAHSKTAAPARAILPTGDGINFNATAKKQFSGSVGGSFGPTVDIVYTAKINWGDGHTSTGAVDGLLTIGDRHVTGAHTYAKAGTYAVRVTVIGQIVGSKLKGTPATFTSVATVTG